MTNNSFIIDKIFSTVCWKGPFVCRDLGLFISNWKFCQATDYSSYCWTSDRNVKICLFNSQYHIAATTQGKKTVQLSSFYHTINYKLESTKAKLAQTKESAWQFSQERCGSKGFATEEYRGNPGQGIPQN